MAQDAASQQLASSGLGLPESSSRQFTGVSDEERLRALNPIKIVRTHVDPLRDSTNNFICLSFCIHGHN